MIITIDGPAGTGKTTIARLLAHRLKFYYFDTGALYRAVTYKIRQGAVNIGDTPLLQEFLHHFRFDIQEKNGEKRYLADGEDVTEFIRTPEVTQMVSMVSAHPEIREALLSLQRDFGSGKNVVFEGRDMGTVVFPKADLKIFLTARAAVRAERRYLEFKEKKILSSEEEVLKELMNRDHADSNREFAPLRQAEDARLVDTSDLTIEQVLDLILEFIPPKK